MTITLSTGAILEKEIEPTDMVNGVIYDTKGWLETFVPCDYCLNKCKRQTYGPCAKAYEKLWVKKYGRTPPIFAYIGTEDRE